MSHKPHEIFTCRMKSLVPECESFDCTPQYVPSSSSRSLLSRKKNIHFITLWSRRFVYDTKLPFSYCELGYSNRCCHVKLEYILMDTIAVSNVRCFGRHQSSASLWTITCTQVRLMCFIDAGNNGCTVCVEMLIGKAFLRKMNSWPNWAVVIIINFLFPLFASVKWRRYEIDSIGYILCLFAWRALNNG